MAKLKAKLFPSSWKRGSFYVILNEINRSSSSFCHSSTQNKIMWTKLTATSMLSLFWGTLNLITEPFLTSDLSPTCEKCQWKKRWYCTFCNSVLLGNTCVYNYVYIYRIMSFGVSKNDRKNTLGCHKQVWINTN